MFNTAVEFSQHIEEKAFNEKRTTLEVLNEYIEENDIPYEDVPKILSRSLYEKLQKDFEDLGMLTPEKNTLTSFLEN